MQEPTDRTSKIKAVIIVNKQLHLTAVRRLSLPIITGRIQDTLHLRVSLPIIPADSRMVNWQESTPFLLLINKESEELPNRINLGIGNWELGIVSYELGI